MSSLSLFLPTIRWAGTSPPADGLHLQEEGGGELCVIHFLLTCYTAINFVWNILEYFIYASFGGGGVILSFLDSFHEKCALVLYVGVVRL
jgi:hypothetical protein